MKTRQLLLIFVLLLAFILAACSPQANPTDNMVDQDLKSETTLETLDEEEDNVVSNEADEALSDHDGNDVIEEKDDDGRMDEKDGEVDDHRDDDMMGDTADEVMSDEQGDMVDDAMMVPEWFMANLTNVNSGETFSIADFKGKVVLVETLAIWCSNCAKQQVQVRALHERIGERDDFVSLGIDIDPNESAGALQSYTTQSGFDWVYTVAPTDVSREIGQLYGDQYLNPPSTPMLIIDREGEVHLLPFGIKSVENLLEALQPFLDAEM